MTVVDNLSKELREHYGDDKWLGMLCWYFVPGDANISLADWVSAVNNTAISTLVPTAPRAVDTFKRAVNKIQERRRIKDYVNGEEFTYKFLARNAGQDPDFAYRKLVVEELDNNMHRLAYLEVATLTYIRANQTIDTQVDEEAILKFPEQVQRLIQEKVASVHEIYNREQTSLGPIKVRELIRGHLENTLRGSLARPGGGVYFVSTEHLEQLDALDSVVNSFAGPSFHMLPLVDTDRQREMIKDAFESQSLARVDELMARQKDLLIGKSGAITINKAKAFHSEFLELTNRLTDYSSLLDDTLEATGNRLKLLQKQTVEVFKQASA